MQYHAIKGKYKAAIDQLVLESKFVSTYTQRYITDPFLRINGLAEYIAWPLTKHQDTQIASMYTNDVIPASDFRIDNHVGWNALLDDVLVGARKDFGQEHVTAALSHLCFDANGSSMALAPSAAVPNTLGVLIIWLPSTHRGGRLVFQSEHHSETVDEMKLPQTMVLCMATYLSTQLVSTQIVWGRRVALVYNLVCTKPELGFRTVPQAQEVATAALLDIANEPLHLRPLVFRYVAKPSELLFSKLPAKDAALVDALLATGCYDVALATVARSGGHDYLAWGVYETKANVIVRCNPHVDCSIPQVVWENLVGMPIDWGLELASYTFGKEALIFWPKRYRTLLAGAECVLSSLRSVIITKTKTAMHLPLEIDSTREHLLGAMSMFMPEAASRLPFKMHTMALMGSLLLAYNEWELVCLFVAHVVSITPTTPIDSIGPFLHACVGQYGWVRLRPAISSLIDRWVPNHTAEVLQLLTSLAGITHDAVCPPLRHEEVAALVKTSWRRVLANERLLADDRDPVPTFVTHYLLLQWYTTQPCASEGRCLTRRLPTELVQLIESFVSPKSKAVLEHLQPAFVHTTYDSSEDGRSDDEENETRSVTVDDVGLSMDLVVTLPLALVAVLRSQPSVPVDVYADALVSALSTVIATEPSLRIKSMPLSSIGCIVTSLDATGRCSAAVLAHMWELWRFSAVAALDALVTRRPSALSPATANLFGDFLVVLAPRLPLVEEWALRRLEHERDFPSHANGPHRARVFPAALRILLAVAPDQIEAFAASWLCAVPSTIEANRMLLLPAIHALAEMKLVRVAALVAVKCLATFEAAGVREPLPNVADYRLSDIFVQHTHCTACRRFRDFLWDGCQTMMALTKSTGKCVRVAEIVAAHPSCLEMTQCGWLWEITKKKSDVECQEELMEAPLVNAQREKDRESVLWLDILVAQAPVLPYDPAHVPRKRQRIDDCKGIHQ